MESFLRNRYRKVIMIFNRNFMYVLCLLAASATGVLVAASTLVEARDVESNGGSGSPLVAASQRLGGLQMRFRAHEHGLAKAS